MKYREQNKNKKPVGERFSALVHTSPAPHPSPLYSGYRDFFSGVMRPGHGVNHLLRSSVEVKERVELFLYFLPGPSWLAAYLYPSDVQCYETLTPTQPRTSALCYNTQNNRKLFRVRGFKVMSWGRQDSRWRLLSCVMWCCADW
jgi:hypothetical protein